MKLLNAPVNSVCIARCLRTYKARLVDASIPEPKLYGCFSSVGRVPFWSTLKLVVACWLVLPQFQGAGLLYEYYVRPFFYQHRGELQKVDTYLSTSNRRLMQQMSPTARSSVAQYISENGHDAFERIMSAVSCSFQRAP